MECPTTAAIKQQIQQMIEAQNLESANCIKAICNFLLKPIPIVENELQKPINTYSTTFDFLKEDVERYRA